MVAAHAMKRIPRIKFPQRHPKPTGSGAPPAAGQKGFTPSGTVAEVKIPLTSSGASNYRFKADVPAPPNSTAVGGKASVLPKRTPLSEQEIEAILLGGYF